MKLFLIIPTLRQGGAERVMSELTNYFASIGNLKIHLVLLAKSDDFYHVHPAVTIHRLGFENKGKVSKIFSELSTFIKLRNLFLKYRPDAILSFMEKYNSFTLLASSFLGLKVFVSDRSNPLKSVPISVEILRKLTYRHAAGIIAQTTFAKEILSKKIRNSNIAVIPNPVKRIQEYTTVKREKIILSMGRLVPEKGHKYLIEAFSNLKNKRGWKVVILGDGPLKSDLDKLIKLNELYDYVLLPGAVKNIDEWLAKASIFVFPSISEGFPNALVEAMSAGLPSISFDCDAGPRDIIKNGINGILIPAGNIEVLQKHLDVLINSESERVRLGLEALTIQKTLSSEVVSQQYFEFLTR